MARAQAGELLGAGDPLDLATQFVAILWDGLLINMLLGVAAPPTPEEIEPRAKRAAQAFLTLHPPA